MSNKQKRIKINILLVVCVIIIGLMMHGITALAANVNAQVSSANAVVGDNVTVAVTISSGEEIFGFDAYVQYDESKLDYVSGSTDGADLSGGNGRIRIYNDDTPTKSITINLTFKVKEAGSHSVYLTADSVFYDDNVENMDLQASTGTITATNVAPASNDSTLKDFLIYVENEDGSTNPGWFWPAFNRDTTEYYLNVENSAKKLAITATANDSKATVNLSDTNLAVGSNTVTITVKAEDGSTRTYKIIVNKADKQEETTSEKKDEEDETTAEVVNNTVNIGDKTYNITNYSEEMNIPEGYEIIDYDYSGNKIKALKGLGTSIILIALSDTDNNIENFVYNEATGEFYKFITVNVKSEQYVILDMPTELKDVVIPEGYKLKTIDFAGTIIDAYVSSENNVYIIYAMDCNGENGVYYFDIDNNTMMKYFDISGSVSAASPIEYNSNEVNKLKTQNRIIIIASVTICLVMLGIILALIFARKNGKDEDDEFYDDKIEDEDSYTNEEAEYSTGNEETENEDGAMEDEKSETVESAWEDEKSETVESAWEDEKSETVESNEKDEKLDTKDGYGKAEYGIGENDGVYDNEIKDEKSMNIEAEDISIGDMKEAFKEKNVVSETEKNLNESLEQKNEEILEVLDEVLEEILAEERIQESVTDVVEEENVNISVNADGDEITENLNNEETVDKDNEKADEISAGKETKEDNNIEDETEVEAEVKVNIQELLEDDSRSLNDEELEMVLDELLDNIFDEDK